MVGYAVVIKRWNGLTFELDLDSDPIDVYRDGYEAHLAVKELSARYGDKVLLRVVRTKLK
jgi:hypothetical protein